MRAVVLLSGGLDSLVAAALTRTEAELILALTSDYGQRAARREIAAAQQQAAWLGCPHRVIDLPWLGALGGSALTETDRWLPEPESADLEAPEAAAQRAQAVWVPNRNGVLVNVAAAFAERLGAEWVVCGFNAEEAATFPDNSRAFMQAADALWRCSTLGGVSLHAPTADLDKAEIVRRGRALGVPLESVWSCYLGEEKQCGRCESCRRLQRAMDADSGGAG